MKRFPQKWLTLVVLVFAAFGTENSVTAQPLDANQPAQTEAEADAQAKQLYIDGDMHYAAGRYEMALENFSQSYELSKRPNLLFNIANVHERLGNYEEAAESLRTYVGLPTATDVSSINERIKRLELNAEQQRKRLEAEKISKTKAATPVPPAHVAENPVEPVPASPKSNGPSRLPGVLVTGLGVALIGGGVTSGFIASSAGSDAEALCTDGFCSKAAETHIDKQKRFALVSDISVGLGIATVGVGAYLLLRGSASPEKEEGMAFSAGPTSSGWGVSMMGSF